MRNFSAFYYHVSHSLLNKVLSQTSQVVTKEQAQKLIKSRDRAQ